MRTLSSHGLETGAPADAPALLSPSSVRAYYGAWRVFIAWCQDQQAQPLPASPESVCRYLEHLAPSRRAATLTKHLAAIAHMHQSGGFESPAVTPQVRRTRKGIARKYGSAKTQKAALLIDDLRAACEALPDSLIGKRDKCLLLLGFAGAFRRSELVALDVADAEFTRFGLRITLRRSKTDQEGKGRDVAIPFGRDLETCPVRATREWLDASKVTSGPLLRAVNRHGTVSDRRAHPELVAQAVKKALVVVGLDPAVYAGHSLRAGLATSAAMGGADDRAIVRQTGHKSREMVDSYVREANLWRDNAATRAGL